MGGFQAGVDTPISVSGLPLSDSQKAEILETYAPKVWLAEEEKYFPSPVEFSFMHNRRLWEPEGHDNWWLYTYEDMAAASSVLDYFHGCDGYPCQLSDVPVYAFWDEVDDVLIGSVAYDVVDLVYFFWFPYNRGKYVAIADTTFGHHVGDWEHISIRLKPEWDEGTGQWVYVLHEIYLSAHDFGETYSPDEITEWESTHPVVFTAWGSHGIWLEEGDHHYDTIDIELLGIKFYDIELYDYTSPGSAWDTWNYVEGYDYDNQAGLAGNAWPTWMSDEFDNPELGYTDPASGPIYRWGTDSRDCVIYCIRSSGPTGPVSKNVWDVQDLK